MGNTLSKPFGMICLVKNIIQLLIDKHTDTQQ